MTVFSPVLPTSVPPFSLLQFSNVAFSQLIVVAAGISTAVAAMTSAFRPNNVRSKTTVKVKIFFIRLFF